MVTHHRPVTQRNRGHRHMRATSLVECAAVCVCVCTHNSVCVSVIPRVECNRLAPQNEPRSVSARRWQRFFCSQTPEGHSFSCFFWFFLHCTTRCQNKYSVHGVCECLTGSLFWCDTLTPWAWPEAAAVTSCSDTHFTACTVVPRPPWHLNNQTSLRAPEPCSESSNPIIAGLTVIV